MAHVLSSLPEEFIQQVLSEFNKATTSPSFDAISIDERTKAQAIEELSKIHAVLVTHPTDVAIGLLEELDAPRNVIKLAIKLQKAQCVNYAHNKAQYTFTWRLDQSVPSVQAVLFNIANKHSNEVKTMRMDLSAFHKLRFHTASLLKEHETLSKRIFKE